MFFVLGLGTLIYVLVRPGPATLGGTLLLSGAIIAVGVVIGWLFYAFEAPSVLTLNADSIRAEGPLIRKRVATIRIQEILRVRSGKAGPAYLFETSTRGFLGLGDILVLASHYDRVEIERFIAATGRPVNGDFTDVV
ncbi:MAG TPA: hypothetical protein VF990_00495 [Candidatus Dormibacteraeota bacterium]